MAYKHSFIERTEHRDEKGGYERWILEVDNKPYKVYCDIRIPGVKDSAVQGLPAVRDKVIVVDLYYKKEDILFESFDPKKTDTEHSKEIQKGLIDLILNVIRPNRSFRYVAFVVDENDQEFYGQILSQISKQPSKDIIFAVQQIIKTETQMLMDAEHFDLFVGDLN